MPGAASRPSAAIYFTQFRVFMQTDCGARHKEKPEGRNMRLIDLKESEDGVLVATAAGRVSLSEAVSVFTKVCDVAAERGNRILVDVLSVEGELSTMERYELGRTVAEYCKSRSLNPKVATVGTQPLIDGFGALVARNRGLLAETFSELQKARDWLKRFGSRKLT
jgi:hypothetical protein